MDAGRTTDRDLETATSRGRARPRWAVPLLVVATAVAAAGCTVISGPGTETVRGILSIESSSTTPVRAATTHAPSHADALEGSIEAPDTVRVDEPFTATVRTIGRNGCWEAAGEDVSVEGLTATVVPFDREDRPEDAACTTALVSLSHDVELTFREEGEATIRAEGRRILGLDSGESEPMSLEVTVVVVP